MDIYSNILYVKEEYAALSALAHRCAAADKYRPEACCVAGNYYSLRCGGVGGSRGACDHNCYSLRCSGCWGGGGGGCWGGCV